MERLSYTTTDTMLPFRLTVNLRDTFMDMRERVNAAADFAQESPEPDPSELYTDILIGA